jgi:Mce-associated membrane protein
MTMTVVSDERADPADEKTEPADESTSAADESDTASDATDTAPEADEQAPATDADADTDEGERRPRSWLRRVLVGAVAVVFVAALAGSGVLGWMLWQDREVTRAGEQAQQAAVAYAQTLTSIDSNKVDENFNQVLDGATGEFKDMYSQSSVQLRQLLIDNKASAHGVVVESAIQSASKDKVVVLLFVDQSVSNTNVPDPRIDRSRIKMTMEFVDGRWRASEVTLP